MQRLKEQLRKVQYFDNGVDYFYFSKPFQLIAGYPLRPRTFIGKLVRGVYYALLVVYLGTLLHKICYTFYRQEDIHYVSFLVATVGVEVSTISFMLIFEAHYGHFVRLRTFIGERTFCSGDPEATAIRAHWYRKNNVHILIPQAFLMFMCWQTFITGQYRKKFMKLVIRGEIVGGVVENFLYAFFVYFPTVGFFLGFSIINSLVIGMLGEMEVLADRFRKLDDIVRARLGEEIGQRRVQELPCDVDLLYWTIFRQEFQRCLKRHSEIFEMFPLLQKLASYAFLLKHFLSLGLITGGCLTTLRANALQENAVFIEYPVYVAIEYFVSCRLVEILQDMNKTIGLNVYGMDWPLTLRYSQRFKREYRDARLSTMIILGRSMQRLNFTFGSSGQVSMTRFTEFLNMNYSIVMFLLNIH